MVTRVVSLTPAPDPGDTLLLDGRPAVVLHLLPKLPGRRPAVRAAFDLPCGACDTPLTYDAPWRRWWCPSCKYAMVYDREALAALAREHVSGTVPARAQARRDSGTRQRSPR